jgi:hypothetical protein
MNPIRLRIPFAAALVVAAAALSGAAAHATIHGSNGLIVYQATVGKPSSCSPSSPTAQVPTDSRTSPTATPCTHHGLRTGAASRSSAISRTVRASTR